MTIGELLECLDGAGIIETDPELVDQTLLQLGLNRDAELPEGDAT